MVLQRASGVTPEVEHSETRLGAGRAIGEVVPLRRRRSERDTMSVAVVDGSYEDFLRTRRSLQQVGGSRFFITYADSLEAGYELLRDKVFDVALIAGELRDRSGLELIQRLGGRASRTPLILLTQRGDADLDAAAMGAGAIDYLDKDELAGAVLERTIRYARHTHALEAQLHQALRRVSDANAAKSDFLARMSHDLRTPLNAILGFSEVVRDEIYGAAGSAKYVEYAGHIHDSGRHLLTLINDILDLSKIEAGRFDLTPEIVDPAEVIAASACLIQGQAEEKGLTLSLGLRTGEVFIVADRRAMKQMLVNLLSNAVKFTPRGGRIDIEGSMGAGDLRIAVRDTGIGIAPDDLEAVLQPFGQARRPIEAREEGCGLGLSIVKALIEMHGGRLEIESSLSHGTEVSLIFPRNRLTTSG